MSLIIRQALAKNAQEKRAMQAQRNHVQELRSAGDPANEGVPANDQRWPKPCRGLS